MAKKELWQPLVEYHINPWYQLYQRSMEATACQKHDNRNKRLRFYSLFQVADQALKKHKEHSVVECGCFKGQSTYAIAELMRKNQVQGRLHVFDSFEGGLSEFQKEDLTDLNASVSEKDLEIRRQRFSSRQQDVADCLSSFDFVDLHPGWIPSQFSVIKDDTFSFVHIDVDLYQPTIDSLEFFYPRLAPGGILVCDDYNFADFPGARRAWDQFFREHQSSFIYQVPMGSVWVMK